MFAGGKLRDARASDPISGIVGMYERVYHVMIAVSLDVKARRWDGQASEYD